MITSLESVPSREVYIDTRVPQGRELPVTPQSGPHLALLRMGQAVECPRLKDRALKRLGAENIREARLLFHGPSGESCLIGFKPIEGS